MPDVGAPESGFDLVEVMRKGGNDEADALGKEWGALDVRWLGNTRHGLEPDGGHVVAGPDVGAAARGSRRRPAAAHGGVHVRQRRQPARLDLAVHGGNPAKTQMASLDHTIWFHKPFRADEWWLYDQWSPSAQGARGLAFGGSSPRTAPWSRPSRRRA